jgi:hypothetical protein
MVGKKLEGIVCFEEPVELFERSGQYSETQALRMIYVTER